MFGNGGQRTSIGNGEAKGQAKAEFNEWLRHHSHTLNPIASLVNAPPCSQQC